MKRFAILVMLVLAASCRPSETPSDPSPYSFHPNPVIAGEISNKKVNTIAEDAQGHIWIGTFRGLNKYIKHEFHQYFSADDSLSIPDNQVKSLYLDSKDRLWVSTVNGVAVYTDMDDFRNIPLKNVQNRNIQQILESKGGRMFFSTVYNLYSFNDKSNRIEPVLDNIGESTLMSNCHVDSNDRLWISNPLNIKCYDPEDMRLQDSVSVQGYPTYSYLHKGHILWLAGNRSVSVFDTNTHKFKDVPQAISNLVKETDITLIHPYGDNGLLMNTSARGMFYYDPTTGLMVKQGENGFPFDVPSFRISLMFTDSQGNIWIGSEDQGYTVVYHYPHADC